MDQTFLTRDPSPASRKTDLVTDPEENKIFNFFLKEEYWARTFCTHHHPAQPATIPDTHQKSTGFDSTFKKVGHIKILGPQN